MSTPSFRLSKSRLNSFRQCPKRLWLEVHKPAEKLETQDMQGLFAVGHQVGDLAQRAYTDGLMIAPDNNLSHALAETQKCLPLGKPLFEATFEHEGLLIRADLLLPQGKGWHMAEVKSTASAKDYHFTDLATQVWVAQGKRLDIARATVRHIDRNFVLQTEGDYVGLLMDTEADAQVAALLPAVPHTVAEARATLHGTEPDIAMGEQCNAPFACPFQAYCGRGAPPAPLYPVTLLPGREGKALARALADEGLNDLQMLPASRVSGVMLLRMHAATASGKAYHDAAGAVRAMREWTWPRYFLDFETIGYTVPVWLGTKPFNQVPFQFSCHKVERDGSTSHSGFLDLSGANPSRACAEALLDCIGTSGAVVAYNASFEQRCIRDLAEQFADLAPRLLEIAHRTVDLLPVVRQNYYHRDMRGSFSLKAVLPVLVAGPGYEALDGVKDGTMAQSAYLEAVAPACSAARREQLRRQLVDYCTLDSMAMIELARELESPQTEGG